MPVERAWRLRILMRLSALPNGLAGPVRLAVGSAGARNADYRRGLHRGGGQPGVRVEESRAERSPALRDRLRAGDLSGEQRQQDLHLRRHPDRAAGHADHAGRAAHRGPAGLRAQPGGTGHHLHLPRRQAGLRVDRPGRPRVRDAVLLPDRGPEAGLPRPAPAGLRAEAARGLVLLDEDAHAYPRAEQQRAGLRGQRQPVRLLPADVVAGVAGQRLAPDPRVRARHHPVPDHQRPGASRVPSPRRNHT